MRLRAVSGLLAVALGACTEPDGANEARCPQTHEFGNFGCARVVAIVAAPPGPLPDARRMTIIVRPVREIGASGVVSPAGFGATPVDLTRRLSHDPGPVDTVSAWVVARLLDQSTIIANQPLPPIAADSVLHVLRFAGVGELRLVDSVSLALRRVTAIP